MSSKLNWLLQHTAPGSLVLQSWLTNNGISPSLANKYMRSNWLQKLRAGVYVRSGRDPQWSDAVLCLQNQLRVSVHLAGLTSLAWQGRSHYLHLTHQ
ncbi:AbiEi antitoxin N-terminal domain-containing protein, partial [Salmonella enterica]|nr:AbiEi antitoxin N-terminal domain-containing protein [Salmonella enterica]